MSKRVNLTHTYVETKFLKRNQVKDSNNEIACHETPVSSDEVAQQMKAVTK